MKPVRGKALALWSASAALVVSISSGIAFRGPIIEQWYFRRLRSNDADVRKFAAHRLGEMRSLRGIERLIEVIHTRPERPLSRDDVHACSTALTLVGRPAVPLLTALLRDEHETCRIFASWTLGRIGEDSHTAVTQLIHSLKDSEHAVRICAAFALGEIGSKAISAVPALNELALNPVFRADASKAVKKIQGK